MKIKITEEGTKFQSVEVQMLDGSKFLIEEDIGLRGRSYLQILGIKMEGGHPCLGIEVSPLTSNEIHIKTSR